MRSRVGTLSNRRIAATALGAVLVTASVRADDRWDAAIQAAISSAGSQARSEAIGRSIEGRDLLAIRVSASATDHVTRPTLLVIAGVDAQNSTGSAIAAGLVARIATDYRESLKGADLVVVPALNPDGLNRFATERPRTDRRGNAAARKSAREDADRDRRVDEDGPSDMNGDGMITQMRIKRPPVGLLRGVVITEIIDPDEPRLMRRADPAKGESAEYVVITEGQDQDGDGLIGEDAAEGVYLDSNFPYHWPEFADSSGPTPLSEPESRALVDWMLSHPEIVAVLVYGAADNLLSVPVAGKLDPTNEAPISGGILDDDKPLYEFISRMFKDETKITGVCETNASLDGSLKGWAYAQFGIASFGTPGAIRSDLVPSNQPKDEVKSDETKDPQPDKKDPPAKKKGESEDSRWLAESDARAAAGESPLHLDWKSFDHPQLGTVEIGGWMPGYRWAGNAAAIDDAAALQSRFIAKLLASLPRLEPGTPLVQKLAEGVWRVTVSARNTGAMATRTAMGVRTRRLPATRWELVSDRTRIVSGMPMQGMDSVAAGGEVVASWVIMGQEGGSVEARLRSPECGELTVSIPLNSNEKEGTR